MRPRRLSFEELIDQNKQELLADQQAMREIEKQIDEKQENHKKRINVN